MALPIKTHIHIFGQKWATQFSTNYQNGGQEPEVVSNSLASFSDNNIIPILKISSISGQQHLT